MGVIVRGFKNAFRNGIRTISIILILSISIGMALTMFMSLKTVQAKIDSVKGSIGNIITISPAGIRGFEGGGTLLTDANVATIAGTDHVSKVTSVTEDRLTTGTNTSLTSSIEPGSFGNRQRSIDSGEAPPSQDSNASSTRSTTQRTMTMPVTLTGTNDLSSTAALSASKFDITAGTKFDENSADMVAMVGSDLATKNNLAINSTFTAYGQNLAVVGIFDGGNSFVNSGIVAPLKTVQTLSGQAGQISSVIAEVDSIDNVSSVESALKTSLGSSADISSQQDRSTEAVQPLQNIKSIATWSLIGSLGAGAIIILLIMIMIVRERRREIGVLKAIGASNISIMSQFTAEALVLTLTSSIVGMVLGLLLANPILKVLVNNSSSSTSTTRTGGPGGGAVMRFAQGFGNGAQSAINSLHNVVGINIILYGLLAAVVIAIIGSAIPAFLIAKVRPAEVMRTE